jgi:hypothetical protein
MWQFITEYEKIILFYIEKIPQNFKTRIKIPLSFTAGANPIYIYFLK